MISGSTPVSIIHPPELFSLDYNADRIRSADVENDRYALPPWKTLLRYRVVVTSCMDAAILAAAQFSNTALMDIEDELLSSLHPHHKRTRPVIPHWTHLLIDEVRPLLLRLRVKSLLTDANTSDRLLKDLSLSF